MAGGKIERGESVADFRCDDHAGVQPRRDCEATLDISTAQRVQEVDAGDLRGKERCKVVERRGVAAEDDGAAMGRDISGEEVLRERSERVIAQPAGQLPDVAYPIESIGEGGTGRKQIKHHERPLCCHAFDDRDVHEIRAAHRVPRKQKKEGARGFPFSNSAGGCSRKPGEWSGQSQEQSTEGLDYAAHRADDWSQLGLERDPEVVAPPAGSGTEPVGTPREANRPPHPALACVRPVPELAPVI